MKKIFTLLAAVLIGSMAQAQVDQTFVFTDLNGNVVPDGSTIVVNTINDMGQMVVPLKLKNNTGSDAFGALWENIDALPSGDWQTCVFGQCVVLHATGFSNKGISEAGQVQNLETEWIPTAGSYATWEATLQIRVFGTKQTLFGPQPGDEIAQGATVTIRFEYSATSGIQTVSKDGIQQDGKWYTLSGQQVSNPTHGVYIVNGRKVVKK